MVTRKQRELQFRVDIVLDAAEELFGEMPYDATSVDEIARRAELSIATLYTLFDGKREVYKATIARAHRRFFDDLSARLDAAEGSTAAIAAIIRYHFENFARYQRQFRFFVAPGNVVAMELKAEVEREERDVQKRFFTRLVGVCEQGIGSGELKRGLSPEHLALAILSVPHSILTYWVDGEDVDLMGLLPAALGFTQRLTGARLAL